MINFKEDIENNGRNHKTYFIKSTFTKDDFISIFKNLSGKEAKRFYKLLFLAKVKIDIGETPSVSIDGLISSPLNGTSNDDIIDTFKTTVYNLMTGIYYRNYKTQRKLYKLRKKEDAIYNKIAKIKNQANDSFSVFKPTEKWKLEVRNEKTNELIESHKVYIVNSTYIESRDSLDKIVYFMTLIEDGEITDTTFNYDAIWKRCKAPNSNEKLIRTKIK